MKTALNLKKGSSLIMVLLIIAILSTIGVALLWLTFGELNMSVFMKDVDKAYYTAEAAIEQASINLDKKVSEAQDAANLEANANIQKLLYPIETSILRKSDGSINLEAMNTMYKSKYLDAFNAILSEPTGFFSNIGTKENINFLLGLDANSPEASIYLDSEKLSKAYLLSAQFDPSKMLVTLVAQGHYYQPPDNIDISQKLSVSFSLLPDADNIPYKAVAKEEVTKPTMPDILKKSVICEKNIVSSGGTVNITGDVLCFGTIPYVNNAEDKNASWYKYGGLIAGVPDISTMDMDGNGMSFGAYFGFDTAKTGSAISGSFNILKDASNGINGDVATMGYIHTMYGEFTTPSNITIQGKSFSRSVKVEEPALYSTMTLNDVYNTDNLQIDAHESVVSVNGIYCGFVNASYDIDGSGTLVWDVKDSYQYKNTSSIIINGDSTLNLNGTSEGGIYIGGSSFLKNLVDSSNYPSENRPYMTGMSAFKASTRFPYAFMEFNTPNGETRLYTGNGSYIQNPNIQMKTYKNITNPQNIENQNIFNGKDGNFSLFERATHFKWLWENLWKNDDLYSRYIDTSAISISLDSDQKINGYAYGDIIANGNVYGTGDFKGSVDASNFGLMQKGTSTTTGWIKTFHDQLQPLLIDSYDITKPKLDYIENSKHIFDHIDSSKILDYSTPKVISSNGAQQGVLYIVTGDCNITYNGSNWQIDGLDLPMQKGIIVASGNIYIPNGFSFDGALISAKNIVFKGNSSITYDKDTIANMLLDSNVSSLFKQSHYATDSNAIIGQRISQKSIRIVNWAKIEEQE